MANPQRAEVECELGGETRVLRIDFQAIAEAEGITGGNAQQWYNSMFESNGLSVTAISALVWAGLRKEEPRPEMETIYEWLHTLGVVRSRALVEEAFTLAYVGEEEFDRIFPDQEEETGGKKPKADGGED